MVSTRRGGNYNARRSARLRGSSSNAPRQRNSRRRNTNRRTTTTTRRTRTPRVVVSAAPPAPVAIAAAASSSSGGRSRGRGRGRGSEGGRGRGRGRARENRAPAPPLPGGRVTRSQARAAAIASIITQATSGRQTRSQARAAAAALTSLSADAIPLTRFRFEDPEPRRRVRHPPGWDEREGDDPTAESNDFLPHDIYPLGPVIRSSAMIQSWVTSHEDRWREQRPNRAALIRLFQRMPFNSTIRSGPGGRRGPTLGGLSLRELCQIIDEAGVDRRGFFLSGTCIDYQISRHRGNYVLSDHSSSTPTMNYQLRRIQNVPLIEVSWMAELNNWVDSESLGLREFLIQTAARMFANEAEGSSDIPKDCFILNNDLTITRKRLFPARYLGIYQFRTGGFDRLILNDIHVDYHFPPSIRSSDGREILETLNLPECIRFYIPGSADRALAKLPNCIFQSLAWGLFTLECERVRFNTGLTLSDEEVQTIRVETAFETKSLYNQFYSQWFDEKANEFWMKYPTNDRSQAVMNEYRKFCGRLRSNWNRLIVHGFSNVLLRRFIRFLCGHDIFLDVFLFDRVTVRFVRAGEVSVRNNDLRRLIDYPFRNGTAVRHVVCLQVNLDAEVQTTDILEELPDEIPRITGANDVGINNPGFHRRYDQDIFPGLLHCIALYPPSLSTILRRTEERVSAMQSLGLSEDVQFHALKEVLDKTLNKQLRETFRFSRRNVLEIGESEIQLLRLVNLQRTRMQNCSNMFPSGYLTSANTSYQSERAVNVECEDELLYSNENTMMLENAGVQNEIGVVAYDCETVENLRGCQDRVSGFFKSQPPLLAEDLHRDEFTVPQSHIPYTVQWGFVTMHGTIQDPRNILLNNEVHICYGGSQRLLGDCIEEFLYGMHAEAVTRGFKKVYCYAHNGSGFDSYMILHFVHSKEYFRFKDILITSRGILSITIEAVIHSKKVIFYFRDTKLFFNSALSDLCKIFKVPAEFCKTDFPIARVHARNYFYPAFTDAVREYMENDVWSLAYIIRGINDIIRHHILVHSSEPLPLTKNITLMSLVTYLQRSEFMRHSLPNPFAVDLPSLRNLISYANMGGRVLPFWRSYESFYCQKILKSLFFEWALISSKEAEKTIRKDFYQKALEEKAFGKVMDVTSLYPYAMSHYPMPTGLIRGFTEASSLFYDNIFVELNCVQCHARRSLCSEHLPGGVRNLGKTLALGHFVFFVIRDLVPPSWSGDDDDSFLHFANLCPRKAVIAERKGSSLVYSFEKNATNVPNGCSCYTMFDLYWMFRTGWTFTIISAFGFESTYIYRESLLGMFEQRKQAKRREVEEGLPKSLSTMWKNVYNGGYGINARQDIMKQHILCAENETEDSLRAKGKINPDEMIIRDCNSFQLENGQWLLKLNKHPDSAEYFAKQSPNHIGAAVTSASRHHMNLFLFSLKPSEYGYTDTDSVFITGDAWSRMCSETPWLVDESPDAAMGTYKNDHDGPGNEMVICSFLLAKKVKLHVTLNAEGNVRFHETFKGFNPSRMDSTSHLVHSEEYLTYQKVVAMSQIFFFGELQETFHQTEWRRSISDGISIHSGKPFDIDPEVYTSDNGHLLYPHWQNGNRIAIWIPKGWITSEEHETRAIIEEGCSPIDFTMAEMVGQDNGEEEESFYSIWSNLLLLWENMIEKYAGNDSNNNASTEALLFNSLPSLTPSDFLW